MLVWEQKLDLVLFLSFSQINKPNKKDGERRENERDNGNLQIVSHIDNAFR